LAGAVNHSKQGVELPQPKQLLLADVITTNYNIVAYCSYWIAVGTNEMRVERL